MGRRIRRIFAPQGIGVFEYVSGTLLSGKESVWRGVSRDGVVQGHRTARRSGAWALDSLALGAEVSAIRDMEPGEMKAVILAGGLGTRISEESSVRPKPMVEIGGRPVLWHILKIYSAHGINDFVICLGYKGYLIKEYSRTISAHVGCHVRHGEQPDAGPSTDAEPWQVTLVDTAKRRRQADA